MGLEALYPHYVVECHSFPLSVCCVSIHLDNIPSRSLSETAKTILQVNELFFKIHSKVVEINEVIA